MELLDKHGTEFLSAIINEEHVMQVNGSKLLSYDQTRRISAEDEVVAELENSLEEDKD